MRVGAFPVLPNGYAVTVEVLLLATKMAGAKPGVGVAVGVAVAVAVAVGVAVGVAVAVDVDVGVGVGVGLMPPVPLAMIVCGSPDASSTKIMLPD